MGFAFLAPLFLAAALAIAVPVIVHLTHRERKDPVVFPSLLFLQRVPFRRQRRQRLRHPWLLLLRAAVIALLALAFARPFLSRAGGGAGGAVREAVVLLDRSASMGARGRWDRARAAAREAIAALPAEARVTLAAVGGGVEVLAEPTADRAALLAALDRAQPGDGAARMPAALGFAAERLAAAGGGRVVLVSDFQRAGFDAGEPPAWPRGVTVQAVDVGADSVLNTGVVAVTVAYDSTDDAAATVTARLAASGGAERPVRVRLFVEDRAVGAESATVRPGGAALVRFAGLRGGAEPRRARIELPGDDYPGDDTWHFVLAAAPRLTALVLTSGARGDDAFYLRHALAVAARPRMRVVTAPVTALRDAQLAAAQVVVLHDAAFPVGEPGRRLAAWVARGGGLFLALGERGTLPPALEDSLGRPGPGVDRGQLGAAPRLLDPGHPVFAGLGAGAADALGAGRSWRYRRLAAAGGVLAQYDDGAVALAAARLGAGRVLVWTADLANRWSDLPVQPAFVPLMHQAMRYLADWADTPPARAVGDVALLPAPPGEGAIVVGRPGGSGEAAPASGRLLLDRAGVWSIRRAGASSGLLLAANPPVQEADPARFDPAALTVGGPGNGGTEGPGNRGTDAASAGAVAPAERERRQRLWWFTLAAVLVLVATETIVAHRTRSYA